MDVDALIERLRASAAEPYIGEPVSQLDHALQCAALATVARADDVTIAAALLHDIGHLCAPADATEMPGLGIADHETIGARVVRDAALDERIAWLVSQHVAAKRYLVATRSEYAAKLSDASKATLVFQGGPMSDAEVRAFEAAPRWRDALRLRAWDEQAKIAGARVAPLDDYRALLERLRT